MQDKYYWWKNRFSKKEKNATMQSELWPRIKPKRPQIKINIEFYLSKQKRSTFCFIFHNFKDRIYAFSESIQIGIWECWCLISDLSCTCTCLNSNIYIINSFSSFVTHLATFYISRLIPVMAVKTIYVVRALCYHSHQAPVSLKHPHLPLRWELVC